MKFIYSLLFMFAVSCAAKTHNSGNNNQDSNAPAPPLPPIKTELLNANDFELTTFLSNKDPEILGIFANDANGKYGYGVFLMPEMGQVEEYENVLTLQKDNSQYLIGTTENTDGVANAQTCLCKDEFAPRCTANIVVGNAAILQLQIHTSDGTSFFWNAF